MSTTSIIPVNSGQVKKFTSLYEWVGFFTNQEILKDLNIKLISRTNMVICFLFSCKIFIAQKWILLWRKLQNGKKKNDKDDIENILLKHVPTSL
jgi:hypothetical protein